MSFETTVEEARKYFPDLQVKYKDESLFIKFLGTLLFFNKDFMTSYTTTIGSTIYFPNRDFVKLRDNSSTVILLHELVHVKDSNKIGKLLFSSLYLSPQILALLCLPLLLVSWKISLLFLLFALPFPSYYRMHFEKRAYLSSLYVTKLLADKKGFEANLDKHSAFFINQFKGSYYYFMWPFSNIDKEFADAVVLINDGKRPYDDVVFELLDALVDKS